jgi:hypothetical protein
MSDRCDGLSNQRVRNYSEATCEPSPEAAATKEASSQQATEREAEARRNAYFASGTDEGGRSSRASSDPGALQTSCKYDQRDKNARLAEYYTRFDKPLQDDVAGNALVGALGAAAIGGVVAATKAGGTAAAGALAKAAADAGAKSLATKVRNESLGLAYDASRLGVSLPPSVTEPAAAPASAPSTAVQVGRSSKRGASEVVPEPVRSDAPRIPEALPPLPVRIQG